MSTGILLLLVGNVIGWFQFNAQFVWDLWRDKPILTNMLLAAPMGICLWYAVKIIVSETGELWASKLIGFGVSNFVFAIMTYVFMKESMFTPKTLACLVLAVAIVVIQLFWK